MNFNELFIDKSKTLIINTDLALVLGIGQELIEKPVKILLMTDIGYITHTAIGKLKIFHIGVKRQYREHLQGLKIKESLYLLIITNWALIKQSGTQQILKNYKSLWMNLIPMRTK